MSKLALLSVRMLRYRVAAMLWMFMLLGAAAHDGLAAFEWDHVWAALCLGAAYVAATTVNDVADHEIDLINHPGDKGRPLVSGDASEHDLRVLHLFAVSATLAAGAILGLPGLAFAAVSVVIGRAYSLPPTLLSHRTYLAPAALGVAYVLVPYGLGLVVAGSSFGARDCLLAGAFYALFLARIVLKDFRDRAGDAAYGKPTLLLRFGKGAVCAVSLLTLVGGIALLLAAIRPPIAVGALLLGFAGTIASRLHALRRATDERSEQLAIGVGARMGNGLLLTVLALLLLESQGATAGERTAFAVALAAAFAIGLHVLLTRPEDAVIGYKG